MPGLNRADDLEPAEPAFLAKDHVAIGRRILVGRSPSDRGGCLTQRGAMTVGVHPVEGDAHRVGEAGPRHVEDDPITTPDLMAKLATLMPAPAKATA